MYIMYIYIYVDILRAIPHFKIPKYLIVGRMTHDIPIISPHVPNWDPKQRGPWRWTAGLALAWRSISFASNEI
jgi:hypothetical protein